MELDFSNQIKEFLLSESHQELDNNYKKNKGLSISDKLEESLSRKVEDHNNKFEKKVSLAQLKKVYRRGAGAFSSSHRPGRTRSQWAMARVNMFLKMQKGGKVKDSYKVADQDIAKDSEIYFLEKEGEAFIGFQDIEFDLAHLDLIAAGIDINDQDKDAEELEFSEAEKKTLNKPFRLKDGNKKYGVYVKNPKTGNTILVKFGDPNMEIKRDDPDRRRNFRARHQCDTAKDKTTPRYWSCKFWSKKPVSKMVSSDALEWDDEEVLSEWGWDDASFVDSEYIFSENPDLASISSFIEEEEV
jgi:hypothetical protein